VRTGRGHRVVSGEHNEVFVLCLLDDARDLGDVTTCFLDPDDVRVPRQFCYQVGLEVLSCPARDVVENDREIKVGKFREVLDKT